MFLRSAITFCILGSSVLPAACNLGVMSFNKDIAMDSSLGQKLLKNARRANKEEMAETDIFNERELEAYGVSTSWLPQYSLKVQGCSHVTSWNDDADNEGASKLETKRLVRFRLCPTETCNDDAVYGCYGGSFGDYIVDLDLFLLNYLEWIQEDLAEKCEEYAMKQCGCSDDDNKDDKFDQGQCEFQCWYKTGKSECYIDYTADDDENGFQLDNYLQCTPWYPPGYNGRKLEEEADVDEAEEEEVEEEEEEEEEEEYIEVNSNRMYYLGPHCHGSSDIYMGLFIDDACTEFADNYGGGRAYAQLTGNTLPYSKEDGVLVQKKCLACESSDYQNQASMFCTGTYVNAGKCESHLDTEYPNEAGCNFISGIQYIEQYSKKSKFNPFSYIYSWVDDYPNFFMIFMGAIFATSLSYALFMKSKLKKIHKEREKSKEIAFNAAQVESHYTDVKVKDAFLAM